MKAALQYRVVWFIVEWILENNLDGRELRGGFPCVIPHAHGECTAFMGNHIEFNVQAPSRWKGVPDIGKAVQIFTSSDRMRQKGCHGDGCSEPHKEMAWIITVSGANRKC